MFIGGRGGVIINDMLTIGGGGYGNASSLENSSGEDIEISYGGFIVGLILLSNNKIHLEVNSLIGQGEISLIDSDTNLKLSDEFFVNENSINLGYALTEFFRIVTGVSYRSVEKLSLEDYSSKDFSGLTASLAFEFGNF